MPEQKTFYVYATRTESATFAVRAASGREARKILAERLEDGRCDWYEDADDDLTISDDRTIHVTGDDVTSATPLQFGMAIND